MNSMTCYDESEPARSLQLENSIVPASIVRRGQMSYFDEGFQVVRDYARQFRILCILIIFRMYTGNVFLHSDLPLLLANIAQNHGQLVCHYYGLIAKFVALTFRMYYWSGLCGGNYEPVRVSP
jgi:hypothetical protein